MVARHHSWVKGGKGFIANLQIPATIPATNEKCPNAGAFERKPIPAGDSAAANISV
jgi:hypothetical protein